jgi:hypothetical protein
LCQFRDHARVPAVHGAGVSDYHQQGIAFAHDPVAQFNPADLCREYRICRSWLFADMVSGSAACKKHESYDAKKTIE